MLVRGRAQGLLVNSKDPSYLNVFSRPLTLQEIDMKLRACANVLLPKLEAEQEHTSLPNVIRRKEVEYQVRCGNILEVQILDASSQITSTYADSCMSSLFLQTWFCPTCGLEFCDSCVTTIHEVTLEEFQHHWSCGVPIVVTHVQLQGAWDPQYFVADPEHKKVKVTLIDCDTRKTWQSTVANLFGSFGSLRISLAHGAGPLQQDWLPSEFLADVLPQLCTDFAKSLPCPAMACLDGALNYASHFPLNAVGPDLGLKTYNALASVQDNYHSGSTRLHKDLMGAVNAMLWAAEFAKDVPVCTLWHIFPTAASCIINEFLQ
ncbi:hypothetical protein PILCRDRAFT_93840 [Piloderma croceum F 1598]|uniref:JmjC domain-containing protein n=1 Tax=Piloderma croceum (strain F 1598) TaxID=765440 RepID=A0A0C3ETR9_PILCF|nr:hypothetical protein PILCRDRAFT_93840 [Piloderma croceum F 1598]